MQPGGHGDERYAHKHKLNIKLTLKIFQYQVNFIFFWLFSLYFIVKFEQTCIIYQCQGSPMFSQIQDIGYHAGKAFCALST